MKEKLREYALIAEIISAIAVVGSLVFVGLEIRQSSLESNINTRAIQSNSFQSLMAQMNAVSFEAMINPEFAEFMYSMYRNEVPASGPLNDQLLSYFGYTTRHSYISYFQYQQEIITEEQLQPMLYPLVTALDTDIGKLFWSRPTSYPAEFVEYIENIMRMRQPLESYWNAE